MTNKENNYKYSFRIFYDHEGNINLEVDVPSKEILSELFTAALTIQGVPDIKKVQAAIQKGTLAAIENTEPEIVSLGEVKGYKVSFNALKKHQIKGIE